MGLAVPRWATERTDRETFGPRLAHIAEMLGTPFMPWQRQVADVGCEIDPVTRRPVYRTVVLTVPRQSGKTTLMLCWECDRCLQWPAPQRVSYTAQTGNDAKNKLLNDQVPILKESRLWPAVRQVYQAAGNESIRFQNGSRIDLQATKVDSGHGRTVDLGVIDELFADHDDRREGAMTPAMATKINAQILITSTAGDHRSVPLKRKVAEGRAAVERGDTDGVAYFEWSADDDDDIDDPAVWAKCMPALGHTIDLSVVRHARKTHTEGEFRRAFLNQWHSSEERVIAAELWDAVQSEKSKPDPVAAFGVDAAPDLSWAAIVAADSSGKAELVDYKPGTGWLEARLDELIGSHGGIVALDAGGPVGFLVGRLHVPVSKFTGQQVAHACNDLLDRVAEKRVSIRQSGAFDTAARFADKKELGDKWVWQRSNDVDVSPLVALTLALSTASTGYGEVGVMFI